MVPPLPMAESWRRIWPVWPLLLLLFLSIALLIQGQYPQNQMGGQVGGGGPIGGGGPAVGGGAGPQGQNIGPQGSQMFTGIGDNMLYGGKFIFKLYW
jgi:hypothetical protein